METPKIRAYTPARIVALALVALAVLALGYLRFAPDDDVSVPSGAQAGELALEPCEYSTESGSYAADCGTLVVPESRADPRSRLIAVPVTRIHATSAHPKEPIFRLEGGPGKTNLEFSYASRFVGEHDVVLVGYRGVDGSVRLDCPEVEAALKHSEDLLDEKSFRAYGDAFRSCADRLTDDGVDLAAYGVVQQVDDLEAARKALGYDRIDLLSESAGTRTALIYSWRYRESIHRSVMIGVNPPGHFLWDGETTDEQIGRYADLCAQDDSCRRRTDDLAASMRQTVADMPDRWLFLPIKEGNVLVASFFGLMETTSENAPLSAPMTLDAWQAAADGDASGFWLQSLAADLVFPTSVVWGQYAAFASADAPAVRDYFSPGHRRDSILDDAGTALVWGGGRLADAWPAAAGADDYGRVPKSETETLLVGGTLDLATPPQTATEELLPHLPNGDRVVLDGFGHTLDFWTDQPEAGTRLITAYLAGGEVDDSLYEPQNVDFTPGFTQTAIARIIAGSMVGLAALAALSLLVLAGRVRKRGRIGWRFAALLRSVYTPVLGLGGWLVGALIVVTTMPGVPLDDELLVALSVGVPVGLGVHLAWVHRDWSAVVKSTGFAAAAAGALVGAWLGFNAIEGIVAILTAIVGAAVGGNLPLLALDIAWDGQARDRFARANSNESLEARPSAG